MAACLSETGSDYTMMKRTIPEKKLKELVWWLLRHEGNHDIWTDGKRQEPIPGHNDINEKLARSILHKAQKGGKT